MDWLSDPGLSDGDLDDIFLFWRHVSKGLAIRRAVIHEYGTVKDYLPRLLRYLGAKSQATLLNPKSLDLGEPGGVIYLTIGAHCLGLARPRLLNGRDRIDQADRPFLICREDDSPRVCPRFPVLTASRDEAIKLARKLERVQGADRREWRAYECERLKHPIERLLIQLKRGRLTTFPTELEAQLVATVHRTRLAQAA
jgi:hypothetical protein